MTIYTRTGDQGETDLLRRRPRTQGCGAAGGLRRPSTSWTPGWGWSDASRCPEGAAALLERIQCRMVDLRAALATVSPATAVAAAITSRDVEAIEQAIDRYDAKLEPLETFILPAGSRAAATLHVARAVCRRGGAAAGFSRPSGAGPSPRRSWLTSTG